MRIFYETYSMRGINNALEVFSYATTLRIMILYTGQRKVLEITQFVVLIECCKHKLFWRHEDNNSLWHKIWRIKAPPKVLNLVWRSLSGCLPTMVMLQYKKVPVESACPVYKHENESIDHACLRCPLPKHCWQTLIPEFHWSESEDLFHWWEKILGVYDIGAQVVNLYNISSMLVA